MIFYQPAQLSSVSKTLGPAILLCTLGIATAAHAALTISTKPTKHVTCSAGVCTAGAAVSVLNVTDLQSMLATSPVQVKSANLAQDIVVSVPVVWASSNALTLDSYHGLEIDRAIAINGTGGFIVTTNDGGTGGLFLFGAKGNVTFLGLSNSVVIDGTSYTLVNGISTLASDIAANPSGSFALATGYDATNDGAYKKSPIPTDFSGDFEGLGHVISNLSIRSKSLGGCFGLFTRVDGAIMHLGLTKTRLNAGPAATAGAFACKLYGSLFDDYATGQVSVGPGSIAGGLIGFEDGVYILQSHASVDVTDIAPATGQTDYLGGIVGQGRAPVEYSYATGAVTGHGRLGGLAGDGVLIDHCHATGDVVDLLDDNGESIGGLVGGGNTIANSYATGSVTAPRADAGGLAGSDGSGTISGSFASGAVSITGTFGGNGAAGGLVGSDNAQIVNSYATGSVTMPSSGVNSLGGLVGAMDGGATITTSYSTGALNGAADLGGFAGDIGLRASGIFNSYWDTDTSGVMNLSQGAGNIANYGGITGLSNAQLKSGLPAGFDSAVWGQSAGLNNGLPYLIANPPQ
jgi:hypothetical protein